MRILLMGGTGLVGTRLVERLLGRGDVVTLLTRRPETAKTQWGDRCAVLVGDPMHAGPWMDVAADHDAVVNLVGEGVFSRRWSAAFKELLYESRVRSSRNIATALSKRPRTSAGHPKVLVNASAIGFYGSTGDEELTERSPAGHDFLAQLCIDWERAALTAEGAGVRVAIVRVGVVLDSRGGALPQMMTPFKMFVGGRVGSGRQYVSWIHHEDLVGIICLCLDKSAARGPFNGTAAQPVPHKQFAKSLGRVMHRPSFMPTPWLPLRVMLGEVANVITTGQRVLPKKATEMGYVFKFTDVEAALRDVLSIG